MTNDYTIGKPLLTIQGLNLEFDGKKILRDINIEIKDILGSSITTGQVCTLVGKSGVGKTQLLKIIAGLQKPTSGEVFIGIDQNKVKPGMVGMVAQNYPLFLHRTVISNLMLVTKDKEKIEFYLNEFGLFEHKDKYPVQLSGGQRQRVAIIQQILCSEHFILLDEPFSGLDPLATEKLCQIILKVANMDDLNTVVLSSHIIEPSLAVSDSVWVLGHEYDPTTGEKIPGAVIRHTEDLAAQGLAWREDIALDTNFQLLCKRIKDAFKTI